MTDRRLRVHRRAVVTVAASVLLMSAAVAASAGGAALVPVANDDRYEATRPGKLVVDAPGVLANDSRALLDYVQLVEGPSKGTLTLKSDGSFTYQPSPGDRADPTSSATASTGR